MVSAQHDTSRGHTALSVPRLGGGPLELDKQNGVSCPISLLQLYYTFTQLRARVRSEDTPKQRTTQTCAHLQMHARTHGRELWTIGFTQGLHTGHTPACAMWGCRMFADRQDRQTHDGQPLPALSEAHLGRLPPGVARRFVMVVERSVLGLQHLPPRRECWLRRRSQQLRPRLW